jgi:hypothetical protein
MLLTSAGTLAKVTNLFKEVWFLKAAKSGDGLT